MIVPSFSWLSIDTVECSRVFKYRYWKSFRTNDVACGVQESTIQVIDASLGTNECTFCANEQQKVYLLWTSNFRATYQQQKNSIVEIGHQHWENLVSSTCHRFGCKNIYIIISIYVIKALFFLFSPYFFLSSPSVRHHSVVLRLHAMRA